MAREKKEVRKENVMLELMKMELEVGNPLLVIGEPGIGKTAILEALAEREGWAYYDFRLSQINPEDFLGLPAPSKEKNAAITLYREEWYEMQDRIAKGEKVLLVLEEINRARQEIQNTALSLINERRLGKLNFKSDNFMIAATGNLGMEDGTNVEEWDRAVRTRFITIHLEPTLENWIGAWADVNIEPEILGFLRKYPEMAKTVYNVGEGFKEQAFNFRTWHIFSRIFKKAKTEPTGNALMATMVHAHLGKASGKFLDYLSEMKGAVTPSDILNNYNTAAIQSRLKSMERGQQMELYKSLETILKIKEEKGTEHTEIQLNNFVNFVKEYMDADLIAGLVSDTVNKKLVQILSKDKTIQKIAGDLYLGK